MDADFASYLERVRAHRAELRDSVAAVDDALASPISGPEWRDRVCTALTELAHDFRTHIDLTEGEGGLYADARLLAPAVRAGAQADRRARAVLRSHQQPAGPAGRRGARRRPPGLPRGGHRVDGPMVRHRQTGQTSSSRPTRSTSAARADRSGLPSECREGCSGHGQRGGDLAHAGPSGETAKAGTTAARTVSRAKTRTSARYRRGWRRASPGRGSRPRARSAAGCRARG